MKHIKKLGLTVLSLVLLASLESVQASVRRVAGSSSTQIASANARKLFTSQLRPNMLQLNPKDYGKQVYLHQSEMGRVPEILSKNPSATVNVVSDKLQDYYVKHPKGFFTDMQGSKIADGDIYVPVISKVHVDKETGQLKTEATNDAVKATSIGSKEYFGRKNPDSAGESDSLVSTEDSDSSPRISYTPVKPGSKTDDWLFNDDANRITHLLARDEEEPLLVNKVDPKTVLGKNSGELVPLSDYMRSSYATPRGRELLPNVDQDIRHGFATDRDFGGFVGWRRFPARPVEELKRYPLHDAEYLVDRGLATSKEELAMAEQLKAAREAHVKEAFSQLEDIRR